MTDSMTTEQSHAPTERRSAQRVSVEMFVRERDGDRMWVHPATNLSASGLFLESHSYSQRSSLDREYMELEFDLPDMETPIAVRGEVVAMRRVNGYAHGLAVVFIDLSTDHYDAIATFVDGKLAAGGTEGPWNEAAPTPA
ncbi:MAG: PilZ domain-containing protein [Myxococcales bacterium]|nr:PilZ domain-containing protein [Myxococcales bacterium]